MEPKFTPEEMQALRAPFPLNHHIVREGHKEGGKIRWFVYIDRSAVQDRLDEMFPGEWETTEPKMYPVETRTIKDDGTIETSHEMSATMGITIRGLTRWDGGESDDGSTKSAITNAFRRTAAYGWGIARYCYDIDVRIKTETYSSKGADGRWQTDWKKFDQVKQQAMDQFTQWYNRTFGPSLVNRNASESHQEAQQDARAAGDYQGQRRTPQQALKGNGAPPAGQKKDSSSESQEWTATAVTVRLSQAGKPYLQYTCDQGKPTGYGRDLLRGAGYDCEGWTTVGETYPLVPPVKVTVVQNGGFWNVTALAIDLSKVDFNA